MQLRGYQTSIIKREKENFDEYTVTDYIPNLDRTPIDLDNEKDLSNLRRTKRNIIEILRLNLNPYSSFLTLTYKSNQQDYIKAYNDFKKFIMRLKTALKEAPKYLQVKELQKRGAIHYHIVIFNPRFRELPYKKIYEIWRHGAVHIKPIDDFDITAPERIGNYIGSYLTKKTKNGEIALCKRIYSTSRGLKRIKRYDITSIKQSINQRKINNLKEQSVIMIENFYQTKFILKKS
ncbi:MAG TPA: hypothetical protein VK982_09335 [Bacteroidales bacterium]|nr:hypothetical protein [Bacteroidales bacterium]